MPPWTESWSESALTSLGFLWKAGWAFVLGYVISAMIQAFVPKSRLTRYMGEASLQSVGLAAAFGAISSSCSFAALAAARSLVQKGAHFVAAVAFMFASTNLVIELGILILIFLGWPYLVAEVIGGLLLIVISSLLMRAVYPESWLDEARRRLESEGGDEQDFDWRRRIRSAEGWQRVGRHFLEEWGMVWQEILIGFTVAGAVATFVPAAFWQTLFLGGDAASADGFWVALQNAAVAPLVAAATFIGSMGNIPLATVLSGQGVLFAGIMGFIYSDLMVPPLVKVNAKYYGWKVALYVAGVMYVSIVLTALVLDAGFAALGLTPTSSREIEEVTRFAVDYSFWLNMAAVVLTGAMLWLARRGAGRSDHGEHDAHDHEAGGPGLQDGVTALCGCFLLGGVALRLVG